MNDDLDIVLKREKGQSPKEVRCTTYQMRNMYRQFADGVGSELEMMNWNQHAAAADLCRRGTRVLDVCCGRGLLIPMLRYRAKPDPVLYCGVDISARNAQFARGIDPRRPGEEAPDWGFPVLFVESDVAEMTEPVKAAVRAPIDVVVYTAAIEHMQPNAQEASLRCCREVSRVGARMYLSCPVTRHGDGWNVQYAAHLYEPSPVELRTWLRRARWKIDEVVGLVTKATYFREALEGRALAHAESLYQRFPREQALTMIAGLYPNAATEAAFLCTAV